MMKYPLIAVVIFISQLQLLVSCHRCGCNLAQPAFRDVHFVNFSKHEMDTVEVKLYNPGTNDAIDSFISGAGGQDSSYRLPIYGLSSKGNFDYNTSAPDLIVFLPADTIYYRIRNIRFKSELCEHCGLANSYAFFIDTYMLGGATWTDTEVTIKK